MSCDSVDTSCSPDTGDTTLTSSYKSDPADTTVTGSWSSSSTMHQCSGGGPLAMVTPLHSFDTSHSRLSGGDTDDSSLVTSVGLTSHAHTGHTGHGGDLQQTHDQTHDTDISSQHLPPHFSDPSDQAQFESDKRQIYK